MSNNKKLCLSEEWIANFLRRFNQGIITPSQARDELVKITDELVDDSFKKGELKVHHELMCELRDPCGTIWEHAKKIQDENDRLKEELNRLKVTK